VVRIIGIESGSIAEELELAIGTRVIRINGERVRDGIDFAFMQADLELELEVLDPSGIRSILEIAREPGDSLGILPGPDKIRECSNECVFCFIDGNPPDVRESLWIRDDDFRLSFTYGSYVTLTNLGARGLQRLVDQRLSPLYVSVHATEPEVRIRLLKNPEAGQIMERLRFLTDHGLEVHTQVVLCPEWNTGPHLDHTVDDLLSLGEGVRTLSVVPVGLTRYNLGRPVRLLTREEAREAIRQVERGRERAQGERGYGWCYAGEELPALSYYDDVELTENGVGAVRRFVDSFEEGIGELPRLSGRRIRMLTGLSMLPFLEALGPRVAAATGAEVEVSSVRNRLFGDSVTVAGLLPGKDLLDAVPDPREGDLVLIPSETLNHDELFIDSFPLVDFRRQLAPATVIHGREITAALRAL